MADLHFIYRDGPTRLCCELDDLEEDEITVVLEALKQRFDTVEQGAFSFSIKEENDYSPLQLVLRKRNGDLMDSGIEDKALAGDVQAGREVLNRILGKAKVSVEVEQRSASLAELRARVLSAMSAKLAILSRVLGVNAQPSLTAEQTGSDATKPTAQPSHPAHP